MSNLVTIPLTCPECEAPMVLKPSRYGHFYGCSQWAETGCKGSHGAHPDGRPLGVPANQATKQARSRAHAVFDQLWMRYESKARRRRARIAAYRWLAASLGRPESTVHIGAMTESECDDVIRLVGDRIARERAAVARV
jgi:hypothetical protein